VAVSLARGFGGEDTVRTSLQPTAGRRELGLATAHKGHEHRKVLNKQSAQTAAALGFEHHQYQPLRPGEVMPAGGRGCGVHDVT
jgi:hypothetical protein